MSQYGSPTGSGNPPGKHSDSYLSPNEKKGHFVDDSSYQGNMHIGKISENSPEVGNQPKEKSSNDVNAWANKKDSIA